MLNLFRRKPVDFFSPKEKEQITHAIQQAERTTSGEVRVYIESRCRFVDPIHRAMEIFNTLQMQATAQRNAVLVYVAMKDRQLAVYGDEGIHQRVGNEFWNTEVKKMIGAFRGDHHATGIAQVIIDIGHALQQHFPYDAASDANELPDDIVFGK